MRRLAVASTVPALAALAAVVAAAPAGAAPLSRDVTTNLLTAGDPSTAPLPVTDVHVRPSVTTGGGVTVSLTWSSDAEAAGTRVCERQGTTPDADPTACTAYTDVPAAGGGSPLPSVAKNKPYVFTLFAYDDSGHYAPGTWVALDGTTLALSGVKKISYGASLTLHTVLRRVPGSTALAGRTVTLWSHGPSATATWRKVASRTTSSTGSARATVHPAVDTRYQWRYAGAKDALMATTSAARTVLVAFVVTAKLTRSALSVGRTFRVYGTVRPAQAGAFVYLQERRNGAWVATMRVRQQLQTLPDGTHRLGFVFALRATRAGTFRLRVLRPATLRHAAGTSGVLTVVVS